MRRGVACLCRMAADATNRTFSLAWRTQRTLSMLCRGAMQLGWRWHAGRDAAAHATRLCASEPQHEVNSICTLQLDTALAPAMQIIAAQAVRPL